MQANLPFFSRLIRIFGFAEDTPARQCSNKFAIALAYLHFGCAEDTPPRKKCKRACFFLSAYSYLCPTHAGMVELVDTSDLGSDASRRGGSSPFIRTKEPFRRAPFSLPVRCKQVQIDCISSFCKGVGKFSEPEAESISQQTRGSTKGSGGEKRAARRNLLPSTFAMHCFAAFYVVIILSCGRFVNQKISTS